MNIKFKVDLNESSMFTKNSEYKKAYSIYTCVDDVWFNSTLAFFYYTHISISLLFKFMDDSNYQYFFDGSTVYFKNKKDAEEIVSLIDHLQVLSDLE